MGEGWVYDLERDVQEKTAPHKTRRSVKEYSQDKGVIFSEIFSLAVMYATIKLLLAVSVRYGLCCKLVCVKNTFVNADLKEDTFVVSPEGLRKEAYGYCSVVKIKLFMV